MSATVQAHKEAPKGLEYVAMIVNAALDHYSWRNLTSLCGAIILVFAFAETIVENYSTPPTIASDTSHADPVLIKVG
ncbi:MAG: hypothetical protein AAF603_10740, partial [Pseudomonadota bacterium]